MKREDFSAPLPNAWTFALWLLLKVSKAPHLQSPGPSRLSAEFGLAPHNDDTRRSKANAIARPNVDATGAARPLPAIPGELLAGNSTWPVLCPGHHARDLNGSHFVLFSNQCTSRQRLRPMRSEEHTSELQSR